MKYEIIVHLLNTNPVQKQTHFLETRNRKLEIETTPFIKTNNRSENIDSRNTT